MLAKVGGSMPLLSGHSLRFDRSITAILAESVDVCPRAYMDFMQIEP